MSRREFTGTPETKHDAFTKNFNGKRRVPLKETESNSDRRSNSSKDVVVSTGKKR